MYEKQDDRLEHEQLRNAAERNICASERRITRLRHEIRVEEELIESEKRRLRKAVSSLVRMGEEIRHYSLPLSRVRRLVK